MRTLALSLLIAAGCAHAAPLETHASHGSLVFRIRAAPLANLAYQLDCLSGTVACTQSLFHDLWKATWTPADDGALAVWRSVRWRYRSSFDLADRTRLSYGSRVRTASLLSESIDEYLRWLDVLVLPGDRAKLHITLDQFWPRFSTWWTAHGRETVAAPLQRFTALLADPQVANRFEQIAHFYQPALGPQTEVTFDLIARPASSSEGMHAETNDDHLVIEVGAGDSIESRLPVAAHELCHFFYASRPAAAAATLKDRFAASPDPLATIASDLMDESLATLFGNVFVGRVVAPEETARRIAQANGLYNDRNIDRTAKALVDHVDTLVASTVDDDAFFSAYLHAIHVGLGDAPAPSAYLREFLLGHSPTMQAASERFTRETKAQSVYSSVLTTPAAATEVTHNPRFTVVALMAAADLTASEVYMKSLDPALFENVRAELGRGAPFVVAIPRPPHGMVFVLVADDPASMDHLVDALLARKDALHGVMRP